MTDSAPQTYLAQQLTFSGSECDSVHYDDGNRLLLVVSGRSVLRYSVNDPSAAVTATDIGGGPVLGARFSLDGKVLAVQRSDADIEFFAPGRGPFWQRCRRAPGESVLAFFWAASAGVDFVLATTGGLELYELLPQAQGLRLVEDKRKPGVVWATYSHETRLSVLGCGPLGNKLFGFQFTGAGRIKLPKFELPSAGLDGRHGDVSLLSVYGRLFCAHVDAEARTLVLYRFYRDALLRQHSFPLPSPRVALAVVDNALVVVTLDRGIALVLDVLSGSLHPLATPVPLGLLDSADTAAAGDVHSGLRFFAPDVVVHQALGRVWRLRLDLGALAASAPDRIALVGFLQRRREPPLRAQPGTSVLARAPQGPKALTLGVIRTMLQERRALSDVGRVFDILCASLASSTSAGQAAEAVGAPAAQAEATAAAPVAVPQGSPAASGDELLAEVLRPLWESTGAEEYLRAVVVEYIRAADAAGVPTPAAMVSAAVDSLHRGQAVHQLPMWRPLLMPPSAERGQPSALAAATSVAAAVAGASDAGALAFATDETHRCLPHDLLVRDMLGSGQVLAALRYVRRHRVESLPPVLFMEAAAKSKSARLFHSAFRFCSLHVPGFSALPEYGAWKSRLSA